MKSAGVYQASADLQKCGFSDRKLSGLQCRLVKLQRPPPEMRIFLPMRSACSSTATRRPRLPASMAHIRPAAPPPRTITSKVCLIKSRVSSFEFQVKSETGIGKAKRAEERARSEE